MDGDKTPSRDVYDQLAGSLSPTYRMLAVFLDNVIQTRVLTDVDLSVSSLDDISSSLSSHWGDWLLYMIGFTVCAIIGVILIIVWLLAMFIFPCCRCCGNCGGSSKKKIQQQKSKGCSVCCMVSLLVMTVGLILGVLSLFGVNQQLNQQLKDDFFSDVNTGLGGIDKYLNSSVDEIRAAISDGYDRTTDDVFVLLNDLPNGSLQAIDSVTGIVTLLNNLTKFSTDLPTLQLNLTESANQAQSLNGLTDQLNIALTNQKATMTSSQMNCQTNKCYEAFQAFQNASVSLNFTTAVAGLDAASAAVNITVAQGLPELVNGTVEQINMISTYVKNTMAQPIQDMNTSTINGRNDILKLTDDLETMLSGINIASLQTTVTDVSTDQTYQNIVIIVYWVTVGLAGVISCIVVMNLLGLLWGVALPPPRSSAGCCGCNKSLGGHFLMISVALTFIFYWLFTLIVLVLFVAGGATHTEFCRHVVNIGDNRSFAVLSKFDNLVEGMISTDNIKILPFSVYHNCYDNASLFQALDADKFLNISANMETSTQGILSSVDEIKQTEINIPQVNLTDPQLLSALDNLGIAFGSGDFPALQNSITGNVTSPLLTDIVTLLSGLNSVDTSYNFSDLIESLNNMTATFVDPITSERQILQNQMNYEGLSLNSVSFSNASSTLRSSETVINTNGSQIVSAYINRTADTISYMVLNFTDDLSYSIENELSTCAPLYDSASLLLDAVCVRLLYNVNGIWYSLGWCIGFLIPHIFLTVQLASVFRFRHGSVIGSGNGVGHMDENKPTEEADSAEEMTSSERELRAIFYSDLRSKKTSSVS